MSSNFKKQAEQRRAAIPQLDPEATKPVFAPPRTEEVKPSPISATKPTTKEDKPAQPQAPEPQVHLTQVDTSETPTNRGFSMYPSRHRQVAKDLAYVEDRNPWEIIEDALDEYVVKHYGKEHKRK